MDKGVQKDRDSASTVGGNVKGSESIEGWRSPLSESGSAEVSVSVLLISSQS